MLFSHPWTGARWFMPSPSMYFGSPIYNVLDLKHTIYKNKKVDLFKQMFIKSCFYTINTICKADRL